MVNATAFNPHLNLATPGTQFHRIDKSKDNSVWSVRVSADRREGAMPAKITKEIIESYQMCPYKGYMQLAGNRGNTSDYETLVRNSQTQARTDVAAKMLHDKMHDFLRDADVTFEVLTRGIYLLLDVTHEDEQLKINFDGLQKSTGSSRLGDFHYIPILVHAGEKLGKEQRDLLEVLGLVLGAVQGKQPRWGIFFQGEDRKLRKVKLGGSIVKAQRTLRQIKEMREADTPPKLRLNSHCQICEFRLRCHAKATATDDPCLVGG